MVNRKCRMLFKSLCISMSVMLSATPASPGFQAAEVQTEAQTQETEAVDNGTSPEAVTVSSAEAKEESVPASSEDKASDGETGTEAPQPSGDSLSGGEAQGSDAQEAPKAKERPQSEAPSKPESEPAAQAPGKEETEKESGKKEETPAEQAQPEDAGSSQTEVPDSGKEASETEQAKQENPESREKESESRDTETETGSVQSMDADSTDNQTQNAAEHTVTIEGGESMDGTTIYHAGDTVHIRANVPQGQEFVQWLSTSDTVRFLDGSNTKVEASFTMPDEDVTVRAQFKTTHSVSVQSGYARVNSESTTRAKEGDKVTVVADSVRGKKFKSWTVNSGSISLSSTTEKEAVFTMPDEDVSVSATYEDATAGKPELSLNGNAQNYLVGDDLDITLSNLTVSGCEKTIWTINFPNFVYFHRFVNGVSLANGDADIRVEVKEKGSSSWTQITDIPNYEGHATDVRIIASSRSGDNDLEIAMRNIRFFLVSSRPHDPNDEEAEPLHIYASMVGYTVEQKELVPKREYASANANSNTLEFPIGYKTSTGPGIVCDRPEHNAVGSTFTTTLTGFKGENVQRAELTYSFGDDVEFYSIEKKPRFAETATLVEYKDASGTWSAYSDGVNPSSVKGLRFIGVNDEYGISQEGEAVVAFKGAREGSGEISVHTLTDRFGVPENFDTSCSYTIEKAYLETAMSSDHESADINDTVSDTVETTIKDDLSGLTLHYYPDTYAAPKTLMPLFGLDGATVTVTHASGKSAAMHLNGAVDLSGYHGITDIAITAISSGAGDTIHYSVSYGFTAQDTESVTNRAVSEARNGRDVVKYAASVTIPVTRCIVGTPSAVYAGEAVPFGRDASVSFLGMGLSATQVSSDYSYEITTPDFIPIKTVTLPVLSDGIGMQVMVYPAGSQDPTDLGVKAGGESIEINEKASKIVLVVPAGNRVFTTQQQGMLTFSNTEKENKERFFKIRVNARTSYRSNDEVVEKTFESAGIPLELYKPEEPEEAKDPNISPIENPDSNKGSEDTPKTPETEKEEIEKKDKDKEKKEKEREDLRKAQDEAEQRSIKRAELRSRISKIRQLALNWKSFTVGGPSGSVGEAETESNAQRIARIKQTNLALSKLSDKKASMIRSMMVSRDLSELYRTYGLYPIPEMIVEMNERTHYGKTLDLYRQKGLISISDQTVDQGKRRYEIRG